MAGGEERAAADLSWDSLCKLFDLLVEESYTAVQLVDVMSSTAGGVAGMTRLGVGRAGLGNSLAEMVAGGMTDAEVRLCFGQAAKGKAAWFKRIDLGEMLGQTIAADESVASTDLGLKLAEIERWCFTE